MLRFLRWLVGGITDAQANAIKRALADKDTTKIPTDMDERIRKQVLDEIRRMKLTDEFPSDSTQDDDKNK